MTSTTTKDLKAGAVVTPSCAANITDPPKDTLEIVRVVKEAFQTSS